MIKTNQIYAADCTAGMKQIEDNTIDVIITSPPYNIGKSLHTKQDMYKNYDDKKTDEEYHAFIREAINHCIRVSRYTFFNFQLLSTNKTTYHKIIGEYAENIKDIIIWHKNQAPPAIQPGCLTNAYEIILVLAKKEEAKNKSFTRCNWEREHGTLKHTNIIRGNSNSQKELNHNHTELNTATMPQYIVRWILERFARPGDTILDPFSGSGTTCLVAKTMNMKWIGFEIDPEQAHESIKHINSITTLDQYR